MIQGTFKMKLFPNYYENTADASLLLHKVRRILLELCQANLPILAVVGDVQFPLSKSMFLHCLLQYREAGEFAEFGFNLDLWQHYSTKLGRFHTF